MIWKMVERRYLGISFAIFALLLSGSAFAESNSIYTARIDLENDGNFARVSGHIVGCSGKDTASVTLQVIRSGTSGQSFSQQSQSTQAGKHCELNISVIVSVNQGESINAKLLAKINKETEIKTTSNWDF